MAKEDADIWLNNENGEGDGFGRASFSGSCTHKDPSWEDPEGNHVFLVYVRDHGEPGVGPDEF